MDSRLILACAFLIGTASAAWAETPTERRNAPLTATALRAEEKIVLDGKLDDAIWQRIAPMTEFYEYRPQDAVPAKYATEARIAFDKRALYVGITAHDPDPGKIDAPLVRRDQVQGSQDFFALHIDPTGARKFAQIFRFNAAGALGDGLFNEDTTNEDYAPDFEFEVHTARSATGWTAEVRIPFASLRYSDPPSSTWSIQIIRGIARGDQYRIANARIPRDANCFLCYAQTLDGLRDLPAGRELTATPQMTFRRTSEDINNGAKKSQAQAVVGLDLKYRPRPDLVIDATINPDFSQVELDTPQLAGNAQFALFFPEKRPFFLEGADILSSPFNGAIYTRSITDPAWGARVTQRNDGNDFTLLTVRDDGKGFILLPGPLNTRFASQETKSQATIGRFRSHLGNVSLGALITDRSYEASGGKPAAYNRVAGVDFVWRPNGETRVRGQVLGSFTKDPNHPREAGTPQNDIAALMDYNYRDPQWGFAGAIEQVGRGFRADNGFFSQSGYTNIYQEIQRKWRDVGPFHEVSPFINMARKTDEDSRLLYQQAAPGLYLAMARNTNISVELRPNTRVRFRSEGSTLRRDQYYFAIDSSPGTWLSRVYFETAWGDRADVTSNSVRRGYFTGANATLRLSDRFEIEPRIEESVMGSEVVARGGEIAVRERVLQMAAVLHFTARDNLRLIGQYNSTKRDARYYRTTVNPLDKTETLSLVYGHLRGLGSNVYVGATTSKSIDAGAAEKRRQNEIFVKFSWAFDVAAWL